MQYFCSNFVQSFWGLDVRSWMRFRCTTVFRRHLWWNSSRKHLFSGCNSTPFDCMCTSMALMCSHSNEKTCRGADSVGNKNIDNDFFVVVWNCSFFFQTFSTIWVSFCFIQFNFLSYRILTSLVCRCNLRAYHQIFQLNSKHSIYGSSLFKIM